MKIIFGVLILLPLVVKNNEVDIPDIQLKKCCNNDSILNLKTGQCVPDEDILDDFVKLNVTNFQDQIETEHFVIFEEIFDKDQCDNSSSKVTFKFNIYNIINDKYIIDNFSPHNIFTPNDVCIDVARDIGTNETVFVAQKCLTCPKNIPCVNYCCAEGFTKINGVCQEPRTNSSVLQNIFKASEDYTYINHELFCETTKILKYGLDLWKVNEDGVVVVDGKPHEHNNYCVDQIEEKVLVCHDEGLGLRQTAKVIVMSVSIICIVIVIIFNCVIDELRNNQITGIKIPMCFFLAVSFAITLFSSKFRELIINSSTCLILGLFHQFSVLSIFFWMTCLSISVWLRFRKIQNITTEISRNNFYYSFAIICPTLITIITMVLQLSSDPEHANYVHPRLDYNLDFKRKA